MEQVFFAARPEDQEQQVIIYTLKVRLDYSLDERRVKACVSEVVLGGGRSRVDSHQLVAGMAMERRHESILIG